MSLKDEILNWDGKSANHITSIYEKHLHSSGFVDQLIEFCKFSELQKGASWLIKRYCELKGCLNEQQVLEILGLLKKLEHWETKLHMLQIMPYFSIPVSAKKPTEHFLRHCLEQNQKFVRAWTYNGFYLLAKQYPEYQQEVKQFLEMGLTDESASVKARIRNILKQGF